MPIVALTTDYGTSDGYVGALKGALLNIAPAVQIVDVTHDLEPFSVLHGALVLNQVWGWFPPGTIHVCVVDPTVGTARGIVVARFGGRILVAPDNGLVALVARHHPCEAKHTVSNRAYFHSKVSPTFHGRDILAPVAAYLANGVGIEQFGPPCGELVRLSLPTPSVSPSVVRGEILHVDRFGTLITNVDETALGSGVEDAPSWRVALDGASIGEVREVFADVALGEPVALLGSSGFLEIAVNRGRAADRFGRSPKIELRRVG